MAEAISPTDFSWLARDHKIITRLAFAKTLQIEAWLSAEAFRSTFMTAALEFNVRIPVIHQTIHPKAKDQCND
jgi:hypothetical protein